MNKVERMPADDAGTKRLVARLEEMTPEFHWKAYITNAMDALEIEATTVRVYENGRHAVCGTYISRELVADNMQVAAEMIVDGVREELVHFLEEQGAQ